MQTLLQIPTVHSGEHPVKYWVWDSVLAPWPDPVPEYTDPCWVHYNDGNAAAKRTCREFGKLGALGAKVEADVQTLAHQKTMNTWMSILGFPVQFDDALHGGGLHVTGAGGKLDCHLDYAQHPHRAGLVRALNLIGFVHPVWEAGWGGELYLADPNGNPLVLVDPRPGRVVAFEVGDLSYHGHAPTSDVAGDRVSVAVYLLRSGQHTRTRAQFLPQRGRFEYPKGAKRV